MRGDASAYQQVAALYTPVLEEYSNTTDITWGVFAAPLNPVNNNMHLLQHVPFQSPLTPSSLAIVL